MKRSWSLRQGCPASRARQRGAALYVALIILILLALIGVIGMQVTGLQERMAANYLRVNQAFQGTEARVRALERTINAALFGSAGTYSANQEVCEPVFDPLTWADGTTASSSTYTRRIDRCFPASSRRIGERKNEETGNIYEINVVASDHDTNPTASAVISTIYIP